MDEKEIICPKIDRNSDVVWAQVPGSKSITNRALLMAALSAGETVVTDAFTGGDFHDLVSALQQLGVEIKVEEADRRVTMQGCSGRIAPTEETIYVGSAGTAARFITALLGMTPGHWSLDASEQMRKRPMAPLLDTLAEMGCQVTYTGEPGHFPFVLDVPEDMVREVSVDIESSSQFLSALLMVAAVQPHPMTIHVQGKHGMAYVDMTERMMAQFGATIPARQDGTYVLPGKAVYVPRTYAVEPDVSAACYFYALAALLQTRVGLHHLHRGGLQGDLQFVELLGTMGCTVEDTEAGLIVTGPADGRLQGVTVDMSSFSDQTMTVAALAPFAEGPVHIQNVGHIRFQECDRMAAIQEELTKRGIDCRVDENDLWITPGQVQPGHVDPHGDHRVAMSFSLLGLRVPGIIIDDPASTRKTFGGYFDELERVLAELTAR